MGNAGPDPPDARKGLRIMIGGRVDQESRPKRTYDLESLEELIASLLEASGQGAAVIVEGRRDLLALRSLGLPGPVIMASRLSALDVAEDAARNYSQVILLTDW